MEQCQGGVFSDPVPSVHLVMSESALRYVNDHPVVLDRQMARLRELDAMPTVRVWIATGIHAAIGEAFTLITPAEGPPFVFLEQPDGGRYEERPVVLSQYRQIWDLVRTAVKPLEEYLTWFLANGESPAAAAAIRATASRPA